MFPHIRVSRVFGYEPGQDVHSAERVTILDGKPLKESGSEHLPYFQHSQKTCWPTRYITRFGIVALLKFAVKALAPRLPVFSGPPPSISRQSRRASLREETTQFLSRFTLLAWVPRILGISPHSTVCLADAVFSRRNWCRHSFQVGGRRPFLFPDRLLDPPWAWALLL